VTDGGTAAQRLSLFRSPAGRERILTAYQAMLEQWPVPYEELDVNTRFGATHVIASGSQEAPPLMLVHAFYATATVWQPNVAALSRQHRVYAVDCLGEPNRSQPIRPISSRAEFGAWWTDLMDGLKIESADMAGNSNGGFLTLNQVLLTPSRIRKAALIGPAATFMQMWPFYLNFFLPVLTGSRAWVERGLRWCLQGVPVETAWEKLFLACLLDGLSLNRVFPAVFTDDELRQVRTPVLLLIGDHEVIYSPQQVVERARRLMPCLTAESVPSANHFSAASAPAWVNDRLLRFFAE